MLILFLFSEDESFLSLKFSKLNRKKLALRQIQNALKTELVARNSSIMFISVLVAMQKYNNTLYSILGNFKYHVLDPEIETVFLVQHAIWCAIQFCVDSFLAWHKQVARVLRRQRK
jgi:hypothetical protein